MSVMQPFYKPLLLCLWLAAIGCGDAHNATSGAAGSGGIARPAAGFAGAAATGSNFGAAGSTIVAGTGGSAPGVAGGGGRSGAAGMGVGGASGAAAAGRGGASGAAGKTGISGASGAAGTAGIGGAGGSGAWKPCPATGDCKILPLGDSITYGLQSPDGGGYRVPLFHLALMNGKHMTFVGSQMAGPAMVDGKPFPSNNEGYSGWTIMQVDGLVPMPAFNGAPSIVLLHIGTNDMYGAMPATAPDRLATLIDHIIAAAPNALLVVAKIIPLASGGSAVDTFNAAIPAIVQRRADAGKHILLVDQFTGFPTSELADGVHPNAQGYSRMADKWYAAIASDLN